MQASPYDLREFGFEPVAVEEPAGRCQHVRRQGPGGANAPPHASRCWRAANSWLTVVTVARRGAPSERQRPTAGIVTDFSFREEQ